MKMEPGELAPSPFIRADSGREAPLYVPPRVAPQRLEPHVLCSLWQESKTGVEQRDGVGGQVGGHRFSDPQPLHSDRQRICPEAGAQQVGHQPLSYQEVHHVCKLVCFEPSVHPAEDAAGALHVAEYGGLAQ